MDLVEDTGILWRKHGTITPSVSSASPPDAGAAHGPMLFQKSAGPSWP